MAVLKEVSSLEFSTHDDAPLEGRRTDEIIIGFVGPVGSGVSTAADMLSELLTDTYKYNVKK